MLKAVGQDDAALDASQLMGAVRMVNAEPVVGGLPTYGWIDRASRWAPDGEIVGGSGNLARAWRRATSYPVISADDALDQLNAAGGGRDGLHRWSCASPVPRRAASDEPGCGPPRRDPEAGDGRRRRRSDSRPATRTGSEILVPSWLFSVERRGRRPGQHGRP